MMRFSQVYGRLRRKNWRQYALLAGCCFFSVLLITAYVCMMRAPTVLNVLPEGGDSRKQMMMIFALVVIGCGMFTAYAAGLFFRNKSREMGVFLALGASRQQMKGELRKELALLSVLSCGTGALLGAPLAWGLWQIFRAVVVDTQEMALTFDPKAYLLALAFSLFVIAVLFFQGGRSIRRTNIIDIVQESRKSEPIRAVPRWYGPVGVFLLAAGALLGYLIPSLFITVFHWYPPDGFTAIFYLPALVGLYMILLHTVVNGWRRKRNRYKGLIATSMMRFQGRQTVRNMLVMTVLIAGAYFASFYIPMPGTGAAHGYESRPVDYSYHWRADQDLPQREEVENLARQYDVTLTDWTMEPAAVLGVDGLAHLETETSFGITYTEEYREVLCGASVLSESAYNALTGEHIDLAPGTIAGIMDDEGSGQGMFGGEATRLTNMVTGQTMAVTPVEPLCYTMLFGRFVLDDGDYAQITQGLTDIWRENQVFFNVENCGETYDFAKALFYEIVDRSGPEVEQFDAYDQVEEILASQAGEPYFYARENLKGEGYEVIDYDLRDSSNFRLFWKYMPQFRVLDQADFIKTMAVYLVLFLFISVVCFAAVIVIAFTRCMTIALTNARVYEDLKRLGAPRAYLYRSVKGQVGRVFLVPALVGTALIYAFYAMIMYFNGDPAGITASEGMGMAACLVVVAVVSLVLYGVYRLTLHKACRATIDKG